MFCLPKTAWPPTCESKWRASAKPVCEWLIRPVTISAGSVLSPLVRGGAGALYALPWGVPAGDRARGCPGVQVATEGRCSWTTRN